jgi:hypothetical protein
MWVTSLEASPYSPVPLTTILSHVIPNHPVDGVFRRGPQALKTLWDSLPERSVLTGCGRRQVQSTCRGADYQERASCGQ